MADIQTMTHEEWLAEGKRRFGEDYFQWRFVCPVCGNVAASEEYRAFEDQGADPNSCTCECIGRYRGGGPAFGTVFDPTKAQAKPCDYAGYGLFRLSPVRVKFPDGQEVHCFAFADPA